MTTISHLNYPCKKKTIVLNKRGTQQRSVATYAFFTFNNTILFIHIEFVANELNKSESVTKIVSRFNKN